MNQADNHDLPVGRVFTRREAMLALAGIYGRDGAQLTPKWTRSGDGYQATFEIALDLNDAAAGRPDRSGGRWPPRPSTNS